METRVVTTAIENTSFEIWFRMSPCEATINENSPTCARAVAVRNEGRLVYLKRVLIVIITNGLIMRIIKSKINKGFQILGIISNCIPIPRATKNRRLKKSFRLFTLPIISMLYSRLPSVSPAKKAPIAKLKPT